MSSSRIDTFLEMVVKHGGSDLHLVSGQTPRIRINGSLSRVRFRELSVEDMERIFDDFMDERVREELNTYMSADFAYQVEDVGRFRVNAYRFLHGLAATLRVIPEQIKTLEELGMPPVIAKKAVHPSGLTLVTGPTGSGKSTTLAAIVDHINTVRKGHIISIEDPIEFIHQYKKCVVTQREIGVHSPSFTEALKNALREDPDVVLVGELRDMETISMALTAAETGIQVLGSLHTNGAARTAERIVNVFPVKRQEQVRVMLAESLRMIVSQQLLRTAEGDGRFVAAEVLINNHAAATMIRSGKAPQLQSVLQSGVREGMQALDTQLKELVRNGTITPEEAYRVAVDRTKFETMDMKEVA